MEDLSVLSQGTLGAFILEGVKFLYRKYVVKNMGYEFPTNFYIMSLPVANALALIVLAFLKVQGYSMPVDFLEFGRQLVLTLLASAISVVVYKGGFKPFKDAASDKANKVLYKLIKNQGK